MLLATFVFDASHPPYFFFDAFHAPYFGIAFFPPLGLLVVIVKLASLSGWNKSTSIGAISGASCLMIAVSLATGYFLSPWLLIGSGLVALEPPSVEHGSIARAPFWQQLAHLSFLQAGLLTLAVEILVLLSVRKYFRISHVVAPVIIGNVVSFLLMYVNFLVFLGRSG